LVTISLRAGSGGASGLLRPAEGDTPKPVMPPNFNGLQQIAMIVRHRASAVGGQNFRAKVFRQRHPVPPTRAHALSRGRLPTANTLTQNVPGKPVVSSSSTLAHVRAVVLLDRPGRREAAGGVMLCATRFALVAAAGTLIGFVATPFYQSAALICRVGTPSSSTYQGLMIIRRAGLSWWWNLRCSRASTAC
jgi:hypothetical protein